MYMKVLVFETPSSLIELKSATHNFDLKMVFMENVHQVSLD